MLTVDRESLPSVLKVTAETSDGLIMGLVHREVQDVPVSLGEEGEEPVTGPAQSEIRGSGTPSLGAPERTPLSVAYFEFDVEEGLDNDQLLASAVPSMQADIDLYLQRQQADGSWKVVVDIWNEEPAAPMP